MNFLILGIGLLLLIKGADLLVGSASRIAKAWRVPGFIIGLFIIAIGTSAPEATIGVIASFRGANRIILGTVIGSSVVNIAVAIGLTAMIFPIKVDSLVARSSIPVSIAIQVMLAGMLYTGNVLSQWEAAILLAGMMVFTGYIYVKTKKAIGKKKACTEFENEVFHFVDIQEEVLYEETPAIKPRHGDEAGGGMSRECPEKEVGGKADTVSITRQFLALAAGLTGLIGGASMVVNGAEKVAENLGWSEELIGMTIVAFGTSLPELVTCLVASFKREEEIAIGNIVGSNIFNVLFVLGVSAAIRPIAVDPGIFINLLFMVGISFLLLIPALLFGKISRTSGIMLLAVYIVYLAVTVGG